MSCTQQITLNYCAVSPKKKWGLCAFLILGRSGKTCEEEREEIITNTYANTGLYWENCVSATGVWCIGAIRVWGSCQGIVLDTRILFELFLNFIWNTLIFESWL